jgi:hypothetical protein
MGKGRKSGEIEGLGLLDTEFPLKDVQRILRETNRESKRKRKLPASTVVTSSRWA